MKLDFDKIRQQLRAVVQEHGGKIEINEWNANDGEVLKIVVTFKNSKLNEATANYTETSFAGSRPVRVGIVST